MAGERKAFPRISDQTLQRLPYYNNYFKALRNKNIQNVSIPFIANAMRLNENQVRTDLSCFVRHAWNARGGFSVIQLSRDLDTFFCCKNTNRAVLVGTGRLGRALLCHACCCRDGVEIIGAFDCAAQVSAQCEETVIGDTQIYQMDTFAHFCRTLHVHIGILTVPAAAAQEVCSLMVRSGILAILNFAPVCLEVPEHIRVHNENFSADLCALSRELAGGAK